MAIEQAPINPAPKLNDEERAQLIVRLTEEISIIDPAFYEQYLVHMAYAQATRGPIGPRYERTTENGLLTKAKELRLWEPDEN